MNRGVLVYQSVVAVKNILLPFTERNSESSGTSYSVARSVRVSSSIAACELSLKEGRAVRKAGFYPKFCSKSRVLSQSILADRV